MEKKTIHIGVSPYVLASLIKKGQLHAADFECLDVESRREVWKILLNAISGINTKDPDQLAV